MDVIWKEAVSPDKEKTLMAGEKHGGSQAATLHAGGGPVGQGETVSKHLCPLAPPTYPHTCEQPDGTQAEMIAIEVTEVGK